MDNIVSLMSTKDENDAGAWSEINQWLVDLRTIGKSVIIVHHSSKHGGQRGTSHRCDNLDTIIKLDNHDDGVTVKFEKHRNFGGDEAVPVHIDFEIDDDKAVFARGQSSQVQMQERDQEIIAMIEAGKPQKEIADELGISKGRVSQIKKDMGRDKK